jgi:hypothetical protein
MSRWIPITIDTLHEAKVAALVDALSSSAKADGQADRAPGIIQGVVNYVRRKVESNRANRIDADETTIPTGVRDIAVDIILARLKNALEMSLTQDERTALDRAESNLNRIAAGDDVVEQPDTVGEPAAQSTAGTPSFAGRTRRDIRAERDGL